MATLKQFEANRLNSQKSTGPRSVEGKTVSSMNALKSGIDAQSQIIRGENIADLEALTGEYMERFQPSSPEQRQYVDTLIRDDWQLRRLAKADAQIWEYQMLNVGRMNEDAPLGQAFCRCDSAFTRLQRRIEVTERSYQRALRELERLQSQPDPTPQPVELPPSVELGSEIGFVPQARRAGSRPASVAPPAIPSSPAPPHLPKL